jgi:prepilin-type N-terminal cleavage/methylation domain-containing protein
MLKLKKNSPIKWNSILRKPRLPSNQSGYTIIESLMAIVVVAVLMTAVSPMLVFSTATRLQAKRLELATIAGKSYLDGVRSGSIPVSTLSGTTWTEIIPVATSALKDQAAPSKPSNGSLLCANTGYCTDPANVYCVDFDGSGCTSNSMQDMVVQAFRDGNADPKTGYDPTTGYQLMVRVYRANSFKSEVGDLLTTDSSSTVTSGLGNRRAPLVIMSTEISPQKVQQSYQDYCDRVGCPK